MTALSATAEIAPARKRGTYVAALVFTIFPWAAAVLWAQLVAYHSSWRYVGALAGIWNGLGLLCTLFFYFPPPRVNAEGLSKREIISRVDYVGGFLSITGLILFLAGLQWGGYQVRPCSGRLVNSKLTVIREVSLDFSPCFGTPGTRLFHRGRLWILGSIWCQISHDPCQDSSGTAYAGTDFADHLGFWSQFLFHHSFLAYSEF